MSARVIAIMYMSLVSTAGVLSAQTPSSSQADMKKEMTVSGCLSQGADMTHYTLMQATPPAVGTSGSASAATSAEAKTVTYDLVADTDMKAHLGHKVEVTGTAIEPSAAKPTADAKEPAPRNAMGKGSEVHGALKVKSVKMIASSCS